MPLWNNTGLNKTAIASMFNQLWPGTRAIVQKANGLLYVVMNKNWEPRPPTEGVSFEGVKRISGNKIEKRLLGKLEAVTTVADGAAELATDSTLVYSDDAYGGAQWDLTHYATNFGVPDSEFDRIKGNEAKTKSFIKDKAKEISLAYEKDWRDKISGVQTNGFTRSVLGSWFHAVSDGVSAAPTGAVTPAESTFKDYGGIDRSDAANADFRGNVTVVNGTATLGTITTARNTMRVSGGNVRLGLAGTSLYTALEVKIQSTQAYVTYDETWSKFGGLYFKYGGIVFVQEHRAPAQTIGLLDPDTWKFWMDAQNVYEADGMLMRDPSRKATRVIPTRAWAQLICDHPAGNGKLTGVTGIA